MFDMKWNPDDILKRIKQLHRKNQDLSYNAMTRQYQSLVSAAAYHFGSYRAAVVKAGINYADVTRRPRWTKQRIIKLIKAARRKGESLNWAAVVKRRDELARAAFAALQIRLFGGWDRALHAAGLEADDISRYQSWDKATIAYELRSRFGEDEPLSSGDLQKDDPALHAAAVRYFGTYEKALRAARVDPAKVRKRKRRK